LVSNEPNGEIFAAQGKWAPTFLFLVVFLSWLLVLKTESVNSEKIQSTFQKHFLESAEEQTKTDERQENEFKKMKKSAFLETTVKSAAMRSTCKVQSDVQTLKTGASGSTNLVISCPDRHL